MMWTQMLTEEVLRHRNNSTIKAYLHRRPLAVIVQWLACRTPTQKIGGFHSRSYCYLLTELFCPRTNACPNHQ
jgi:hypothetical protein